MRKKLSLNKSTISRLDSRNILGGKPNPGSVNEGCGSFNPFNCTQACDGGGAPTLQTCPGICTVSCAPCDEPVDPHPPKTGVGCP